MSIATDFKIHCIDVKNALQNYIWLLEHCPTQTVVAIDPTEADLVQDYCQTHGLHLQQIWLTHWHKDHIGGVPDLYQTQPELLVYGPRAEQAKIPYLSHPLSDQDTVHFHALTAQIIAVPGHTLGHIVFYLADINCLFCGDTLFAMGCGRVFEGTHTQMYSSLQKLAALPPATQVYCSHEYTLSNAKFALHVEPDNSAIQQRLKQVQALRDAQQSTLPSRIELELSTNPFLRAADVQAFAHLRDLKDQF